MGCGGDPGEAKSGALARISCGIGCNIRRGEGGEPRDSGNYRDIEGTSALFPPAYSRRRDTGLLR